MDPARLKRKEEISRHLALIQSSGAYPEPEGFEDLLTQLVCNLLEEGNALFRDGDWEQAVKEFSEGLNVSHYAAEEEQQIPKALLESLYVNRAAAYHSMGEYEQAVKDCDSALDVCKESRRALYRKALCLKELGKYREAYNCTTDCMLITRLDKQVNELAQELAVHLGLKNRKPYVSTNEHTLITRGVANGDTSAKAIKVSGAHLGNGVSPVRSLAPVCFPSTPQSSLPSTTPSSQQSAVSSAPDIMDPLEDSELMGDDLDRLLDGFSNEQTETNMPRPQAFSVPSRSSTRTHTVPSVLPAPTPQLPPAFFSSTVSQLNSLDCFSSSEQCSTATTLDALDDLSTAGTGGGTCTKKLTSLALDALDGLDSLDDLSDTTPSAAAENKSETELGAGEKSLDDLLDELHPLETVPAAGGQRGDVPKVGVKTVDQLDSLDALDSFSTVEGVQAALPAVSIGGRSLDSLTNFSSTDNTGPHSVAASVIKSPKNNYKERNHQAVAAASHPLSSTHEFLQACSACFPRRAQGINSFVHKPDLVHSCKGDILLCRRKAVNPSEWTRVRPRPVLTSINGPFVLCREILDTGECKYREKCTFAYNQLEIDVWTAERKGTLDRNLLFKTSSVKLDPVNRIIRILQENRGLFIFLCQECYDSKPRIISQRYKNNHTICSNLDARHNFDANKCFAFVARTDFVNYSKVRPLSVLCHLDLCRQPIRCQREDSCYYAHSFIELTTWRVQRDTGISPDEIVKISTKYNDEQEQNSRKGNRLSSGSGGSKPRGVGKSVNMDIKFNCAQCRRDGRISEPDKALKYCTDKARHKWTKESWLLLVKFVESSKWVPVRPLPQGKNVPMQYYMCALLEKGKCNYGGQCSFAHSQEEKEMWMYMKNNDMRDMQQIYDLWLTRTALTRHAERAMPTQPIMPTDNAEPTSGFHCHLCDRHSNSERQWQQHISTERHKDRVFGCEREDKALTWNYRFPGTCFELCRKLDSGCPDGVSCDYAHSLEELKEWTERRDFLRQKLAKAKEDMLIMPDECDFGKYNYLLQD